MRCVESSCALWSVSGMHSKALLGCISHEKFCNHFNIKFENSGPLNHHHLPDLHIAAEPKSTPKSHISEHKTSYQKSGVDNFDYDTDDCPDLSSHSDDDYDTNDCFSDYEDDHLQTGIGNGSIPFCTAHASFSGAQVLSKPTTFSNSQPGKPICCPCGIRGTCSVKYTRCPCRKEKKECQNYLPCTKGACTNILSFSNDKHIDSNKISSDNTDDQTQLSFVEEKMMQAFGAKLNNSEGEVRTERIDKVWERSTLLQGKVFIEFLVVLLVVNLHQCWQKHMNYSQLECTNQRDHQCLGRSYYKKKSTLKNLVMSGVY